MQRHRAPAAPEGAMDVERVLANFDGRLRRIEETLSSVTGAHRQLGLTT